MNSLLSGPRLGRLYALGSASAFGAVAPFAGLAYAGGASPGAVVLARLLFGLVTGALAVAMLRRPWLPRRRAWRATVLVAVAWITLTVAYMSSFYFIPVSLAVLIFFTFPVLIAVVAPLVDGHRPRAITVGAALAAFTGLALALGPEVEGLDWRGCGLAFAGALGAMSAFILTRHLVVEQDMFSFSLHLHALCVAAVIAALLLVGAPDLPSGASGWVGLLGVGLFYAVAVLLQFGAIRLAGPTRASVVFNAEPIITMLGAALMLGEYLGPWQVGGAALVIGAVLWSTRIDRVERVV